MKPKYVGKGVAVKTRNICLLAILAVFIVVVPLKVAGIDHNEKEGEKEPPRSYEVKQEKVFIVRFSVSSPEEVEELRGVGIKCKKTGDLTCEVTEAELARLKSEGYSPEIMDRAILISGRGDNSSPHIATGRDPYEYGENYTDVDIPDDNGWVYSPITISGAPGGGVVTSIDVHYEIIHTYIGDLVVDLTNDAVTIEYRLWDREGGGADNINETEYGITVFNGEPVNQEWDLWAIDYAPGDSGYIDYWWIKVYYGLPDLIVQSLTASDYTPTVGDDINVTLVIKNQGTGAVNTSFWTGLYLNESSPPTVPSTGDYSWSTSYLGPGETETFTQYYISTSKAEIWQMYGLVDSNGDVDETNENNNVYGPVEIVWTGHEAAEASSEPWAGWW
jgi:subtilisin-like proprotein convertase family protein